jgi:hypothetical protein
MPTIKAILQRLLPEGTRRRDPSTIAESPPEWPRDWTQIPMWPPDVFAVAATLVDRSGCYAELHRSGDGSAPPQTYSSDGSDHKAYLAKIDEASASWRNLDSSLISGYWDTLLKHQDAEISRATGPGPADLEWRSAAMLLMVISDQTSHGIGFPVRHGGNPFARMMIEEYQRLMVQERTLLPAPDRTLCDLVPQSELCVQPKTITVQVGCTLRSYSHNLALLPAVGEVETVWLIQVSKPAAPSGENETSWRMSTFPLNLLVVPFPYQIGARGFVRCGPCAGYDLEHNRSGFFDLRQDWLEPREKFFDEFSAFLLSLIAQAHRNVGAVHGIVLPELALDYDLAQRTATFLAKRTTSKADPDVSKLELFISGVLSPPDPGQGTTPRNSVYACTFIDGRAREWVQHKHHRWKLERNQIARYHLGDSLDLNHDWWERIDVSRRKVAFRVVRRGASMAVLICEDLARVDPVQTVIRSVGPNLVVALLMDSAFNERRWAYRYATVLAGDPGSSVLAVTSLGLITRSFSFQPGAGNSREIAMWSDSNGQTRFLELPKGHHALLLTLSSERRMTFTLDGRSDRSRIDGLGTSISLSLSGVHAIKHVAAKYPEWSQVD